MRLVRLVMAFASEAGVILAFVMFARSCIWLFLNSFGDTITSRTGNFFMDNAVNHAGMSAVIYFAVFITCWLTMYASGQPFRTVTSMPGLSAKRCSVCAVIVPDRWKCSHCGVFRGLKAVSLVLWAFSLIITAAFFVADLARLLLTVFLWRRS